ncbi:diaminopimelate decarboxylase [Chakrabartyella piscis]|uniref:diaminopimelate decarboxylase family protein n=1 Tax=Chakrabartyella piscis TaxID=2918914 RepID=UPI002958A744|nr:diaminopimelate decarboxylase [Chakrabartyella piscis]
MKKPFITLEQAKQIIAEHPTPFHIYDEKGMRENARLVNKAFAWNKGFKEYFAVKATPTPGILQVLKEEGCGADCSSFTELMIAEMVDFKGHDIMFSSNMTPAEDFVKAAEMGAIINFDDFTHIEFFSKLVEIPETVCCRYNPGGMFQVANDIMDNPGDSKYGMTKEQMKEGFRILKEKGAKHFGIHSFLASSTRTNTYYPMLAKILFELAVELKEELDIHIAFINLSGGVGIPYHPEEEACDIMEIGAGVQKVYEEIFAPKGMEDVAIYTEMGRYMMAPYGSLIATAIHEKHIYKEYIGLDACAANLMRPAMYQAYHHVTVLGKEEAVCDHTYDVAGGLCENNDKFAIDRQLPKIDMGDIVYIHDTGAHGHAMGYNYNGKLRSAELLLQEDGGITVMRRAETPEDYLATLDCTPFYKK